MGAADHGEYLLNDASPLRTYARRLSRLNRAHAGRTLRALASPSLMARRSRGYVLANCF